MKCLKLWDMFWFILFYKKGKRRSFGINSFLRYDINIDEISKRSNAHIMVCTIKTIWVENEKVCDNFGAQNLGYRITMIQKIVPNNVQCFKRYCIMIGWDWVSNSFVVSCHFVISKYKYIPSAFKLTRLPTNQRNFTSLLTLKTRGRKAMKLVIWEGKKQLKQ